MDVERIVWNTGFVVIMFLLWLWMRYHFNKLEKLVKE